MSEEKQIEEMSEDLLACHTEFGSGGDIYTDYDATAQKMFGKGYRKQSEGEWLSKHHMSRSPRGRYTSYNTYTCSVCGNANGRRKTPFCPNCGAKMEGGE